LKVGGGASRGKFAVRLDSPFAYHIRYVVYYYFILFYLFRYFIHLHIYLSIRYARELKILVRGIDNAFSVFFLKKNILKRKEKNGLVLDFVEINNGSS